MNLIKYLDFENMKPETMKLLNTFVHADKNEQEFGAKMGEDPLFPHPCNLAVKPKIGVGDLLGGLASNLTGVQAGFGQEPVGQARSTKPVLPTLTISEGEGSADIIGGLAATFFKKHTTMVSPRSQMAKPKVPPTPQDGSKPDNLVSKGFLAGVMGINPGSNRAMDVNAPKSKVKQDFLEENKSPREQRPNTKPKKKLYTGHMTESAQENTILKMAQNLFKRKRIRSCESTILYPFKGVDDFQNQLTLDDWLRPLAIFSKKEDQCNKQEPLKFLEDCTAAEFEEIHSFLKFNETITPLQLQKLDSAPLRQFVVSFQKMMNFRKSLISEQEFHKRELIAIEQGLIIPKKPTQSARNEERFDKTKQKDFPNQIKSFNNEDQFIRQIKLNPTSVTIEQINLLKSKLLAPTSPPQKKDFDDGEIKYDSVNDVKKTILNYQRERIKQLNDKNWNSIEENYGEAKHTRTGLEGAGDIDIMSVLESMKAKKIGKTNIMNRLQSFILQIQTYLGNDSNFTHQKTTDATAVSHGKIFLE